MKIERVKIVINKRNILKKNEKELFSKKFKMKTILKSILPIFIITLIIYSCSESNDIDANNIDDNTITTIFERTSETSIPSNNGMFPDIEKIEKIGKNTEIGNNLIAEISERESYNLNYSEIKRITFSSVKYYTYSIPFKETKDELVIITNNNSISLVISKQITLTNGNKKFLVNNFKNQPLMSLEQNNEGKIGNRKLFKNDNSSFESKSLFPLIENNYLAKGSSCAGLNSFSACMQCMWDECSSSWVCAAILALEPGPTIAFSAALCGLDTLVNAK